MTAACKVVNDVICSLNKKECCIALFIDLSKAFDTVGHMLFWNRRRLNGIDTNACKWFHTYLAELKQ